jgi:hypothetical protein
MQEKTMFGTALKLSAAAMLMISTSAAAQAQQSEAQIAQPQAQTAQPGADLSGQIEDQVTLSFDAKDELSSSERRELEAYEPDELASLHDEDQVTQSFDAKDELSTFEIPEARQPDQLAQMTPPTTADQESAFGIQGELEVKEPQLSLSSPPAADEPIIILEFGIVR